MKEVELLDKDLLDLFLGRKNVDRFLQDLDLSRSRHDFDSENLHKYQFNLEELQPFCMSLKHFSVGPTSLQHFKAACQISPFAIAFLLRLLPSLLTFGISGEHLCNAVYLLSKNSSDNRPTAKKPRLEDSLVIMSPFEGTVFYHKKFCEEKLISFLCPFRRNSVARVCTVPKPRRWENGWGCDIFVPKGKECSRVHATERSGRMRRSRIGVENQECLAQCMYFMFLFIIFSTNISL